MSAVGRVAVRCAVVVLVLVAVHELLILGLDRTHVVERLLAPAGAGRLGAAALAVGLLVLRLTLLFVLPGAVLTRLVNAWLERDPTAR